MKKNREIFVVCHCILNCDAKIDKLSNFKGIKNISKQLIEEGYGIIQLPCPEMIMYGINRWPQSKEQFDNIFFRKQCRSILGPYVMQLRNYMKNNYYIKGIIGIEGSSNCGYKKTNSSKHWHGKLKQCNYILEKINSLELINEKGVFIEELEKLLDEHGINIPIIGISPKMIELKDIINSINIV